jgi:hypothetical protein
LSALAALPSRDPQLEFFETPEDSPEIGVLINLLQDKSWWGSAEITARLFPNMGAAVARTKINSLAAAACPRIISGDLGYKLTIHATPEELDHFCNQMRGRGQAMVERAEKTRRFAHRIFG